MNPSLTKQNSVINQIPEGSLFQFLEESAVTYRDRIAVIDDGREFTYDTLYKQTLHLSTLLASKGVKQGDRVMLMLPNCVEYVLSYYAILRLGAIVVQVNPGYQSEELSHMYSIAEPCLWIGESIHKDKVEPLKLQCLFVDEDLSTHSNEDLERVDLPDVTINAKEDVAVIQFTGGTTGIPKGAMLTHRNLMANVVQTFAFAHGTYERGEEVFLGVSPFYHVLGMSSVMNQGLYAGATIVTMRKWNVEQGLRLIETYERHTFQRFQRSILVF
ncbi:class I adenylate-forming enzyme family protein [Geomicrobium sp. JCM 19055]|uniref:class I adenylate-forming enzyme family protein n=1 Tax=Geomicrobium sp. JCM 19055 TaxID=1460649 RepID=UPI000693D6D9